MIFSLSAISFLFGVARTELLAQDLTLPIDQSTETAKEYEQRLQFNLDKLKDRSYTDTYGDGYTWYTAVEELGQIGEPAVPHLIRKLDTKDQYELKLALYALMLATQDFAVKQLTSGEYINLPLVLDEKHNPKNRRIALRWWERHKKSLCPFGKPACNRMNETI